jgi:Zn-finger nucleic acid-binding protein
VYRTPAERSSLTGTLSGAEPPLEPLLDVSDAPCPRCGKPLSVVTGGGFANDAPDGFAVVNECVACGGVFLDSASLRRVLAHSSSVPPDDAPPAHAAPPASSATPEPVRYLKCPVCSDLMNRVNFGRRSGIVVDVCTPHGTWFDAGELARAIDFVARGGLEASRRHDPEERRELARTAALFDVLSELFR